MTEVQEYLGELKNCFTRILDLSQQQLNLAELASTEKDISTGLLGLMQEREELSQVVDSLMAQVIRETGTRNIASQAFSQVIAAIDRNDQQTRILIEQSLGEINQKLQAVRSNRKAYQAYIPATTQKPWFIDKKR